VNTPKADQEDAPLANQVTDPTRKQEQAAERDQVRVDHPREVVLRETKVLLDRREGDVDDRGVEDDHQHPDAHDVESQPASPLVRRHRGKDEVLHRVTSKLNTIPLTGHGASLWPGLHPRKWHSSRRRL
jgi:hypothetical protein